MGFLSKTFDMKSMVRKLNKKPEASKPQVTTERNGTTHRDLSEYVFKQLFLPILRSGAVPTEGLDFDLISEEDLDDLSDALHNCQTFELYNLADAFLIMPPATSSRTTFI